MLNQGGGKRIDEGQLQHALAQAPVRVLCALASAGFAAVVAPVALSIVSVNHDSDGINMLLPILTVAFMAAGLVLIGFAIAELRRPYGLDRRQLSELATALGALPLLMAGLALFGLAPFWGSLYLLVGVVGLEVRNAPRVVFYSVLGVGVVACLAAIIIVITAPATLATAFTWLGAMLLRQLGERRDHRFQHDVAQAEQRRDHRHSSSRAPNPAGRQRAW